MKKITTILFSIAFILCACGVTCFGENQIMHIKDSYDFNAFMSGTMMGDTYENSTIILDTDIDINSLNFKFKPIGNSYVPFCGTFDGNGHTINLEINSPFDDGVALFAWTKNAVIRDLTICGCIYGNEEVAAFVAHAEDTTLVDCKNFAEVVGNMRIGQFIGNDVGTTTICGCKGFVPATNIGRLPWDDTQCDYHLMNAPEGLDYENSHYSDF